MALEPQIKGNKIFAPLKNCWLVLTAEEKVRQEYICRLVNNYGFKLDQMAQEVKINNSKQMQGNAYADIVIWKSNDDKKSNKAPLIVVECKAQQVTIRKEDYYKGAYYAALVGANFFVTNNIKETRIFSKIYKIDKKGTSYNLNEIINIPKANDVNNEKEINNLLSQTKEFARDEFSKVLSKCHNIIRNNDKLSPEAAFDEISKILFIKTLYERKNQQGQIFLLEDYKQDKKSYDKNKNEDDLPFFRKLFDNVKKELKNDDLFESNETIRIRENSFEAIVKELEIYNLSTTSDDIKGIAFEQFLGRTFRGELGQFFTPRTIVDYMVEILDPQEGETICDPCCGSGGFLIKAFEFVRAKIENEIQVIKEKIKTEYYAETFNKLNEIEQEKIDRKVNKLFNLLNIELDVDISGSRLRRLSFDCIVLLQGKTTTG
ncbi:MAG: type I restriction enzyme HsdR N-terminal domain-containing protein [Victivallaceae bacterium]|jgi:type I restriction enzyme M protein